MVAEPILLTVEEARDLFAMAAGQAHDLSPAVAQLLTPMAGEACERFAMALQAHELDALRAMEVAEVLGPGCGMDWSALVVLAGQEESHAWLSGDGWRWEAVAPAACHCESSVGDPVREASVVMVPSPTLELVGLVEQENAVCAA